ncbi:Replicative DNA helicase, partial [Haemophilus influenzae]
CNDKL